ncbi:hypothetical protein TNCV_4568271 [Trichonephila clavipes]|nr:hypothetical protein TNCV_4568271 [Trichonephila clavipes]
MVLDIVVAVSRTEHAVDEEDAAEIDKLLEVVGTVVTSGEPSALQCRTPSRHHLELQGRRDYTPADRAARTCWSVVWTGKEEKEKWNDKKMVENREGSLGFVKPVFTKDSKPLGKRKRSLGHLGSMKPALT